MNQYPLNPKLFDYVGLFSWFIEKAGQNKSVVYSDLQGKLARQFATPPKLYWIGIGNSDSGIYGAQKFHTYLDSLGYRNEYHEVPGDHSGYTMRREALIFIPKLFKKQFVKKKALF